ncbi:hypothetical protein V2J09_019513 [Rumex salicifolius]
MDDKQSFSSSSSKAACRKTVEKNRRDETKGLFTKLNSLVPSHIKKQQGSSSHSSPREHRTMSDQIDAATKYIKELEAHMERLKHKKNILHRQNTRPRSEAFGSKLGEVEVHARGNSALEVLLITGLDCCYDIFKQAIHVIQDEGVDIVNASFSGVDDGSMFHTIHGKIGESATQQGIVERITERLETVMLSLDS